MSYYEATTSYTRLPPGSAYRWPLNTGNTVAAVSALVSAAALAALIAAGPPPAAPVQPPKLGAALPARTTERCEQPHIAGFMRRTDVTHFTSGV
ncbi:MAG TPA: hypothetical protein VFN74_20090 [Chloroflexota bacterium]|nr:hypothetical protein [Chloroflexota bacterium]